MHAPPGGSRPQRRGAVMSRARDTARRDGQEARGSERQGRVRRGMGQLCRHHTSGTPPSLLSGTLPVRLPSTQEHVVPRHPPCTWSLPRIRPVSYGLSSSTSHPPGGSRGRVGTALKETVRLHQRGSSQPKGPGPSLPPWKQATRSHDRYCIRGILSVPKRAPREVTAGNAYGRP